MASATPFDGRRVTIILRRIFPFRFLGHSKSASSGLFKKPRKGRVGDIDIQEENNEYEAPLVLLSSSHDLDC